MISKNKYLKYKKKYLETKMVGGGHIETVTYRGVKFTYDDFRKRCKERLIKIIDDEMKEKRGEFIQSRTVLQQSNTTLITTLKDYFTDEIINDLVKNLKPKISMEGLPAPTQDFSELAISALIKNFKNLEKQIIINNTIADMKVNLVKLNNLDIEESDYMKLKREKKEQISASPISDKDHFMYDETNKIKLIDFQEFKNKHGINELFKSYLTKPNNFNTKLEYKRYGSCLDHVYKMPEGSPYLSTSSSFSVAYEYALSNCTMGDLICIGEYNIPNTDIATSVDEVILYLTELNNRIQKDPDIMTEFQHCFSVNGKSVFDIRNIVFELINNKQKIDEINLLQKSVYGQTEYAEREIGQLLNYTFKLREYDLICNPAKYLKKMYIFKCDTFDTMWQHEKNKGYYIGPYGNNRNPYIFEYNDVPNYRLFPLLTNKFVFISQPVNIKKELYTIMTVNLRAGLDILGRRGFRDTKSDIDLTPDGTSKMDLLVMQIVNKDCDIICIQEFGYQQDAFLQTFYEKITAYNIHYVNTHQENIAILVKKEYNTKNEDIGIIPSSYCPTQRNYILLRIHSLNITILNVHMCGGGTDDQIGSTPEYAKSRDIEFILKLCPKIDIICGDFNGDAEITRYQSKTGKYVKDIVKPLLNAYMGQFAETVTNTKVKSILELIDNRQEVSTSTMWSSIIELIEDFKEEEAQQTKQPTKTDEMTKLHIFIKNLVEKLQKEFYDWIARPFTQLNQNNYTSCVNVDLLKSFITTPYGTLVDYIYCNNESIDVTGTELINLIYLSEEEIIQMKEQSWTYPTSTQRVDPNRLSDHNGIMTEFKIKSSKSALKTELYKTQYKVELNNGNEGHTYVPIEKVKVDDPEIVPTLTVQDPDGYPPLGTSTPKPKSAWKPRLNIGYTSGNS